MRFNKTKMLIIFIIFIFAFYIIYHIFFNKENRIEGGEILSKKEKIIVTDLRIGVINFDNINPILSQNVNVQNISRLIFEPLINLSNDFQLEPCLATEWLKSDENTYLIKLRKNVKWQDGQKFDSDDVIFTINILKNINSIYSYNVQNIKEVKKIDEYTIKIITATKEPYFEYNLIFPIMSSTYFNNKNFSLEKQNSTPVGTGMYYISDNNKDVIILKKNTNWWNNKNIKLDTININLYNNMKSALTDFKFNNVDLITSSLNNIDEYTEGIQCNKEKYIGRNLDYLSINCESHILKDKEVRKAINMAINKDEIIKQISNDKYIKSYFPLDFGTYMYFKNSEKIEYNIEKAKSILKDKKLDGKEIKLNLLVDKNNKERVKVAKIIKKQLEGIGFKINILEKTEKEYKRYIKNKNYDLALTGITYSYSPNLNLYFDNNNIANYKNKDIINDLKKIEESSSIDEQRRVLSKIISKYNEDTPYIMLYYNQATLLYSRNLIGKISPNSYNIFYNIEDWHREYDKK